VVGKKWKPQIFVNLPLSNVQRCVSRIAKPIGLQYLQLLDVAAGSGPPDRTRVIYRRTDELCAEQQTVSDANFRALPDSRCFSFRRQISTSCSLRNSYSSKFLPRTPSAFQQASRKPFPPFVPGCTAILSYEQNDGFEDSLRASFPCKEEGGRGEKTVCQLYAGLGRKFLQEIGDPLERRLTLWWDVFESV
jgi:hypothetical protein